jgi:hypothetical protein
VCLVGVEEPAAELAVLVEVTTGDLDARRVADAAGLDRVDPAAVISRSVAAAA